MLVVLGVDDGEIYVVRLDRSGLLNDVADRRILLIDVADERVKWNETSGTIRLLIPSRITPVRRTIRHRTITVTSQSLLLSSNAFLRHALAQGNRPAARPASHEPQLSRRSESGVDTQGMSAMKR